MLLCNSLKQVKNYRRVGQSAVILGTCWGLRCNNYGQQAGYLLEETIQVIIYNYNEKVSTHIHMSVFLKMYVHEIKTTNRVCGNIFLMLLMLTVAKKA